MADAFDLARYLSRIGYLGTPAPDLPTLAALHAAHVAAIPFEGLDPLLGRPVKLDLASLQAKIVEGCRGGYCFEQNGLFKAALETIGFRVTGLGGRVRWMSPPASPLGPRTHMLLKVDFPEGPYLADVGFGACLMDAPLRLHPGLEQRTAMGTFRLIEEGGLHHLSALQPAGWRVMYVFDLVPQIQSDYELGNYFTSTNAAAPFTSNLLIERVDGTARHKLTNRRFVTEARDGEVVAERDIGDAAAFGEVLRDTFNIVPPVPVEDVFARLPV